MIISMSSYRQYLADKRAEELRELMTALKTVQGNTQGTISSEATDALDLMHAELLVALRFLTKGQGNAPANPTSV